MNKAISTHMFVAGWRVLLVGALAAAVTGCAADKPVAGYGLPPAEPARAAGLMPSPDTPTPDTEAMYRTLIERMQAQGLFFASLAHIAKFEQQYGANADTRLMRARALRETGQFTEAAALYRAVLDSPQSAAGWQGLGLIAGAEGRFADAAQSLSQAAQRAPTDARILNDFGYALMRSGQLSAARVPLAQAAELDQSNPQIVANLAVYLRASGETGRADAVVERAQLAPNTRAAIVQLADTLRAEATVAAPAPQSAAVAFVTPSRPATAQTRPVVSRADGRTGAEAPASSPIPTSDPQPIIVRPANAAGVTLPMHSMFERFGAATP